MQRSAKRLERSIGPIALVLHLEEIALKSQLGPDAGYDLVAERAEFAKRIRGADEPRERALLSRAVHSRIGCSTQNPMRLRRNVDRAIPSIRNLIVPSAVPEIDPVHARSMSPWRCSTQYSMRKWSDSISIFSPERWPGTVPQSRSRTATYQRRTTSRSPSRM